MSQNCLSFCALKKKCSSITVKLDGDEALGAWLISATRYGRGTCGCVCETTDQLIENSKTERIIVKRITPKMRRIKVCGMMPPGNDIEILVIKDAHNAENASTLYANCGDVFQFFWACIGDFPQRPYSGIIAL